MIVYIPTPITSVEQAESLPEGTIAKHPEYRTAAVKTDLCEEGIALWYDTDDGSQTATSLLGWTALVPVEAEEEYSTDRATFAWDNDAIYSSPQNVRRDGWVDPLQRRFTTMWETVTDPDRTGDCA